MNDNDVAKINSNGTLQGLFDVIETSLSRIRAMAITAAGSAEEGFEVDYWGLIDDLASAAAMALEKLHEQMTANKE